MPDWCWKLVHFPNFKKYCLHASYQFMYSVEYHKESTLFNMFLVLAYNRCSLRIPLCECTRNRDTLAEFEEGEGEGERGGRQGCYRPWCCGSNYVMCASWGTAGVCQFSPTQYQVRMNGAVTSLLHSPLYYAVLFSHSALPFIETTYT